MKYIFVINNRLDKDNHISDDLKRQLTGKDIIYDIYRTEGVGDGIRFVRIYSDLHQNEEVCFVACGGSGTANEVASGIIGFKNKSMALLAYGSTNDFTKNYPERDFHSVDKILEGDKVQIDIIKANDNYSINVINIGFDGVCSFKGNTYIEQGMDGVKAFKRAVFASILTARYNSIKIVADGKQLNRKKMLLCAVGNGIWCGGQYRCAPYAVLDDGLMEVCLFKTCSLLTLLIMMKYYEKGEHLTNSFCKKRLIYCRAKHLQVTSKSLIYSGLDGETIPSCNFEIDVLPKALNLILPKKTELI